MFVDGKSVIDKGMPRMVFEMSPPSCIYPYIKVFFRGRVRNDFPFSETRMSNGVPWFYAHPRRKPPVFIVIWVPATRFKAMPARGASTYVLQGIEVRHITLLDSRCL